MSDLSKEELRKLKNIYQKMDTFTPTQQVFIEGIQRHVEERKMSDVSKEELVERMRNQGMHDLSNKQLIKRMKYQIERMVGVSKEQLLERLRYQTNTSVFYDVKRNIKYKYNLSFDELHQLSVKLFQDNDSGSLWTRYVEIIRDHNKFRDIVKKIHLKNTQGEIFTSVEGERPQFEIYLNKLDQLELDLLKKAIALTKTAKYQTELQQLKHMRTPVRNPTSVVDLVGELRRPPSPERPTADLNKEIETPEVVILIEILKWLSNSMSSTQASYEDTKAIKVTSVTSGTRTINIGVLVDMEPLLDTLTTLEKLRTLDVSYKGKSELRSLTELLILNRSSASAKREMMVPMEKRNEKRWRDSVADEPTWFGIVRMYSRALDISKPIYSVEVDTRRIAYKTKQEKKIRDKIENPEECLSKEQLEKLKEYELIWDKRIKREMEIRIKREKDKECISEEELLEIEENIIKCEIADSMSEHSIKTRKERRATQKWNKKGLTKEALLRLESLELERLKKYEKGLSMCQKIRKYTNDDLITRSEKYKQDINRKCNESGEILKCFIIEREVCRDKDYTTHYSSEGVDRLYSTCCESISACIGVSLTDILTRGDYNPKYWTMRLDTGVIVYSDELPKSSIKRRNLVLTDYLYEFLFYDKPITQKYFSAARRYYVNEHPERMKWLIYNENSKLQSDKIPLVSGVKIMKIMKYSEI